MVVVRELWSIGERVRMTSRLYTHGCCTRALVNRRTRPQEDSLLPSRRFAECPHEHAVRQRGQLIYKRRTRYV